MLTHPAGKIHLQSSKKNWALPPPPSWPIPPQSGGRAELPLRPDSAPALHRAILAIKAALAMGSIRAPACADRRPRLSVCVSDVWIRAPGLKSVRRGRRPQHARARALPGIQCLQLPGGDGGGFHVAGAETGASWKPATSRRSPRSTWRLTIGVRRVCGVEAACPP